MSMKKASKPGQRPVDFQSGSTWWGVVVHDKSKTACKHGTGPCETCGTFERTDSRHTTVGGKGLVQRLKDRK